MRPVWYGLWRLSGLAAQVAVLRILSGVDVLTFNLTKLMAQLGAHGPPCTASDSPASAAPLCALSASLPSLCRCISDVEPQRCCVPAASCLGVPAGRTGLA